MYLKFIPVVFLLLILHGVVHATNPRGMGIGLRYGYAEDQTFFFLEMILTKNILVLILKNLMLIKVAHNGSQ
mgnify:CR=1 FL=1